MKLIKEPIIDSSGKVTGFLLIANKDAFIPASKPPAAAAGGLLAGINAALLVKGKKPVSFPGESMIGSLMNFISNKNKILSNQKKNKFQPMPPSFGLVPELNKKIKDKKLRYQAYQERSTEALKGFKEILDSCFEKDQLLSKIY